jgi:uncharacterized protein YdeI (YjbR/CyaY-like superfamily)
MRAMQPILDHGFSFLLPNRARHDLGTAALRAESRYSAEVEQVPSETMSKPQRFRAVLEPDGTNLRWTVAKVPFDPAKVWPERNRLRVRGTLNGIPLRSSLFGSKQKGYLLLVNRQMQKAAGVQLGEMAEITLEPDLEERPVTVPPEFARLLKRDRDLARFFEELNPSARRDVCHHISEPKGVEVRRRRAEQMAERMLLALEGESILPPILQIAFRKAPRAEQGWRAMTPHERRGHLLGIFYYQSPEARERRAEKAVAEALRMANSVK